MKKLLSLLTMLIVAISASANGTITAATTTDLGSGKTPRYVVEEAGVGRLMKNKTGSSAWTVSSSGVLATGSSLFALQTYNEISAIKVYGYGTGNGRTFSKLEVGTSTSNYAEVTATGDGTMSSTATTQTITITPASNIAANSYVAITFSGNINVSSVELVYASVTKHTVTFDAGTNGTCATTSITEASPGAGVTLPTVTANAGYAFNGWYTASTGGTKVGDAGNNYKPSADTPLYAQYSELSAPTINVNSTSVSTNVNVAVTFTATADGAPDPTVTWYKNESASTTGGTSVGTGLTYQPDVTAGGTYYYYAVASNGVEPDATSEVITLTVTDPNKYIEGNAYYISEGETAVKGEQIVGTDITMTFAADSGAGFTTASADNKVSSVNSSYVASIAGSNSNANGWGAEFVATKDGSLSVGVIINKKKTFTITNVTSFTYKGVKESGDEVNEEKTGNTIVTPDDDNEKLYIVATIDVAAGTTYKFSVGGSKMGFYGFVFVPEGATETITTDNGVATYVTKQALNFTGLETKAYVVTGVNEAKTSVATAEVTTVPAGTALLVKGAAVNVPVIANATAPATNLLQISTGEGVQGADNIFAYSKSAKQFKRVDSSIKVPAGKCYLVIEGVPTGNSLDVDFNGATAINNVNANDNANSAAPVKVIKNGKLYIGNYNVAGQQVK